LPQPTDIMIAIKELEESIDSLMNMIQNNPEVFCDDEDEAEEYDILTLDGAKSKVKSLRNAINMIKKVFP